jgi:hypothetical protein
MEDFDIPEPGAPDPNSQIYERSFEEAVSEKKLLSSKLSPKTREVCDWIMRFCLKPILFMVVLLGSAWWVWDVSQMVWQSEGVKHFV